MQDYTTGWFDTLQNNLQAKCNVRVIRTHEVVRLDWSVYMSLKVSSASIPSENYIDVLVNSNAASLEQDTARIKNAGEAWNGTIEHSINGSMELEDANAGQVTLTFNSIGNFASPEVFENKTLEIGYEKFDPDTVQETSMPFHSVFTTEEYLATHKGLIPRNIICNN